MPLRFQWQIDRVFSFDLFGPGFSSIFPWERKRGKIYNKLIKKKRNFQNNENIRSSIQK